MDSYSTVTLYAGQLIFFTYFPVIFFSEWNKSNLNHLYKILEDFSPRTINLSKHIRKFADLKLGKEVEECSICWEAFEKDLKVIQLSCSKLHVFHASCMTKLL